jgi:ABC-2 type transport system permease protein
MMSGRLTASSRLFLQGALLSYRALFRWLRPATYLASKVAMPLSQILFFTLLGTYATGRGSAAFYIVGNSVQMAAVSGIYGVTMSIGGDRWQGTLVYLFGTPANRLALFLGRSFFHILDGIFGVFVGFLWGVILLGLDLSRASPAALILTVLTATVSTSGLGLLMGGLALITRNIMFVNNTVYFLLLILSGANIPPERLPAFVRTLSRGLPLTRAIEAARRIVAGQGLSGVGRLLAAELAVGAVYIALGYVLFRWFESQARRRGTIELL